MVHNLAQSRPFPTLHPFPFTKISKDKDANKQTPASCFPPVSALSYRQNVPTTTVIVVALAAVVVVVIMMWL